MPFLSYFVTGVYSSRAIESRSWTLLEDRSRITEVEILVQIVENNSAG